jgi:hypothetical protein
MSAIKENVNGAIKWEMDLNAALARAKAEEKPVFLDFFNPQ